MRKKLHQNHSLLAARYAAMARAIQQRSRGKEMTDEEKKAVHSLEEQVAEHKRKAIFRNNFIMIV